jgi:hypothetical protein
MSFPSSSFRVSPQRYEPLVPAMCAATKTILIEEEEEEEEEEVQIH